MANLYGRIHSFESFGTVDGPGIRFVVFMQGCALKCKYCHNRDAWDKNGGSAFSVADVIGRILPCKSYIDFGHGGVTVSGGEPLLQAEFVTALFKELKALGIHTALDTAGGVRITPVIEELLSYTDLVLLDIKHIDNEKCIALTGFSNTNTLRFASYLGSHHIPVWVRQVLVPGYTDDPDDLLRLRAFIQTIGSVERVELLPYHELGKYKWAQLGDRYALDDVRVPTKEEVAKARELFTLVLQTEEQM
jgi:pyruvate formate lyase activating enzyme